MNTAKGDLPSESTPLPPSSPKPAGRLDFRNINPWEYFPTRKTILLRLENPNDPSSLVCWVWDTESESDTEYVPNYHYPALARGRPKRFRKPFKLDSFEYAPVRKRTRREIDSTSLEEKAKKQAIAARKADKGKSTECASIAREPSCSSNDALKRSGSPVHIKKPVFFDVDEMEAVKKSVKKVIGLKTKNIKKKKKDSATSKKSVHSSDCDMELQIACEPRVSTSAALTRSGRPVRIKKSVFYDVEGNEAAKKSVKRVIGLKTNDNKKKKNDSATIKKSVHSGDCDAKLQIAREPPISTSAALKRSERRIRTKKPVLYDVEDNEAAKKSVKKVIGLKTENIKKIKRDSATPKKVVYSSDSDTELQIAREPHMSTSAALKRSCTPVRIKKPVFYDVEENETAKTSVMKVIGLKTANIKKIKGDLATPKRVVYSSDSDAEPQIAREPRMSASAALKRSGRPVRIKKPVFYDVEDNEAAKKSVKKVIDLKTKNNKKKKNDSAAPNKSVHSGDCHTKLQVETRKPSNTSVFSWEDYTYQIPQTLTPIVVDKRIEKSSKKETTKNINEETSKKENKRAPKRMTEGNQNKINMDSKVVLDRLQLNLFMRIDPGVQRIRKQ